MINHDPVIDFFYESRIDTFCHSYSRNEKRHSEKCLLLRVSLVKKDQGALRREVGQDGKSRLIDLPS
jgi:hypothetical protein